MVSNRGFSSINISNSNPTICYDSQFCFKSFSEKKKKTISSLFLLHTNWARSNFFHHIFVYLLFLSLIQWAADSTQILRKMLSNIFSTKFIIYWIIFWTIHFNLTFIFIADYKSKCTIKVTSGYNVNKILLSFHEFIEIVLLCWGFSLGTKFEITNDLLFFRFWRKNYDHKVPRWCQKVYELMFDTNKRTSTRKTI